MPFISLQNISTPYCLQNVNLEVKSGEFLAILGPTGAGKSTLLNVIAGLTAYEGDVYYDRQKMNHIPTEKRNLGYLLQDVCLFPHLNTFDNVAFGLRAAGYATGSVKEKVNRILALLQIAPLKKRYPRDLSGGEKQRVGLARSIIMGPQILLLDEPLSSLDPATAGSIRRELKLFHNSLNLTTLYVTHDFNEVRELANRAVVVTAGQITQMESFQEPFFPWVFPQLVDTNAALPYTLY